MDREAERREAEEFLQRWEQQVEDALLALFDRQQGVVLARLTGVKARKDTRHWFPPGERKVDPRYVLDQSRWVPEAAAAVRSVFTRMFDAAAKRAVQKVMPESAWDEWYGAFDDADPASRIERRLNLVAQGVQSVHLNMQQFIERAEATGAPMGEIEQQVKDAYESQKAGWATSIAQTNVAGTVNEAAFYAASLMSVGSKQWFSMRDMRVRTTHRHADGQIQPLLEPFKLGGIPEHPAVSFLMFPGDPAGPPGEVINCRCTMLFARQPPKGSDQGDDDLFSLDEISRQIEGKAMVRKVRTAQGVRFYKEPIGSVIKPDAPVPHVQLGGWHGRADGLDTPISALGLTYNPHNAEHPAVVAGRSWQGWGRLPTVAYSLDGKLHATEPGIKSGPVRKVLGGEPLRKGYDPHIVRTDSGDFVADGHHRVAMHKALGHDAMPAKVLDLRGKRTVANTEHELDMAEKHAKAEREKILQVEAHDIAASMVAQAKKNEPQVTPIISEVVAAHGGHMEGLKHRVKTVASTKRKIVTKAHRKNTTASGGASGISDVLRYTAVMDEHAWPDGVKATVDALGAAGFHPTVSNNYWAKGDAYSGLNMLFRGKGQDLEVQFHTPASFALKEANHDDYEVSRDDAQPLEARMAAWNRMVAKWDAVPQPDNWWKFGSLFIYDSPESKGKGRYVDEWEARGVPKPPPKPRPAAKEWDPTHPETFFTPKGDYTDEHGTVHKQPAWYKKATMHVPLFHWKKGPYA